MSIGSSGGFNLRFFTSATTNEQFRVANTASAVNFVQVTGAATGVPPVISAQGSDTNIHLTLQSKGSNGIRLSTAGASNIQAFVSHTASAVNFLQLTGAAAGFGPVISAQGSDTNIPAVIQPKGTGALQAQQTTSTAAGGNARGANAVDWQTSRSGASQVASAQFSVISGGVSNTSSAFASTVSGGNTNTARGNYNVVAGGNSNQADGNFNNSFSSVVGGYANLANGHLNFVGGGFANSTNTTTPATNQSASITSGSTAVTLSASNASIRVGQLITATGINTFPPTYVAAISGTSLTLSQNATATNGSVTLNFFTPHGVVVGGGNNQATGAYSFIGGGGDAGTAANRNVASGDWSTVAGGFKNTASQTAGFVGGGAENIASQQYGAVLGGNNNNSSGYSATILGGRYNQASGTYSTTVGGFFGATRAIEGSTVFSACNAPIGFAHGVSQAALLILARQTTDATPTVLASNVNAPTTNNQVILPNNSAYFFRGEVISGRTGGGDAKGWTIEGVIKRGANAASTTLVGTPTVTSNFADAGASTWTIAVTADTTNGGLAVAFTGQAGTTIRTVAQIRTTEMTF
jgi:hypothetical protein